MKLCTAVLMCLVTEHCSQILIHKMPCCYKLSNENDVTYCRLLAINIFFISRCVNVWMPPSSVFHECTV